METLDELLREAEIAHGHLCAGQVLGVRMAMLGCRLLGIDDPRGKVTRADRKRLVTFVEIDRCATDAIGVVTGCRLGKRALKFRDWGKMAASFLDLGRAVDAEKGVAAVEGGRAVRIAARESSRERAKEMFPGLEKNAQQMAAYRELPGYKAPRIVCAACGEGISYDREVVEEELIEGESTRRVLCRGCADVKGRYYQPL